jgi:transcriptional regulator with XRE-family HTH domain
MSTPHVAVKKLREHVGESQQAFATRLGMSIRAIANYEKDREPTGRALVQLMKLADESGRPDLARVFQEVISKQLGHAVPRFASSSKEQELLPGEADEIMILLEVMRAPGYKKLKASWIEMTAKIRESHARSDASAIAITGLNTEIRRLMAAGKSNEDITRELSAHDASLVQMLCTNLRALHHLAKEKQK